MQLSRLWRTRFMAFDAQMALCHRTVNDIADVTGRFAFVAFLAEHNVIGNAG
jgi:hypothetical protein